MRLLTESEYQTRIAADPGYNTAVQDDAHPLCKQIRDLRKAAKLSLAKFEEQSGIPAVVVGAYERGDRIPPLSKLDAIFGVFGYRLAAVPVHASATRLPTDMVAELRAIADQLEGNHPRPADPTPDQAEEL